MERCISCGEWYETDGEATDGCCSRECLIEFIRLERDAAALLWNNKNATSGDN